jgi:hypothetical protein
MFAAPREAHDLVAVLGNNELVDTGSPPRLTTEPPGSRDARHERQLLHAGLSEHHLDHGVEIGLGRRRAVPR